MVCPQSSAFGRDWRAAVLIAGIANSTISYEAGALIFRFGRDQGSPFGRRVSLEHFILEDLGTVIMYI